MAKRFIASPSHTGLLLPATGDAGVGFTSYQWNTNDSSQVITIDSSGSYCLIVTDQNTCRDSDCVFVTVLPPPTAQASFTADVTQACEMLTVNFTNNSLNATDYSWDFGDGSPISMQPNPTHTYDTSGIYTVSLIAINATSSDTAAFPNFITVFANPVFASIVILPGVLVYLIPLFFFDCLPLISIFSTPLLAFY